MAMSESFEGCIEVVSERAPISIVPLQIAPFLAKPQALGQALERIVAFRAIVVSEAPSFTDPTRARRNGLSCVSSVRDKVLDPVQEPQ
jgi:hypothetical protein